MPERIDNVLFLCTANSARSVLAEAYLNRAGAGRFRAFSAGSTPRGSINPAAAAMLADLGHPIDGLRSKSWDEFGAPGAPQMDYIFTVCDNAAGEACPVWPGHPANAHWGIADPAAVAGDDIALRNAFLTAYAQLAERIGQFMVAVLTIEDPAQRALRLAEIGRLPGATAGVR